MNTQPISRDDNSRVEIPGATSGFEFNNELNAEFLSSSYGENLEFGMKMFSIFLATIEEDIEILTHSMEAKDYHGVKDIAHKIKNNFTWVGLPKLSSVMYKIELAAKEKSENVISHYNDLMDIFHTEHMLVQKEYDRLNSHLS